MSTRQDFSSLQEVAKDFRKTLKGDHRSEKDLILLFAHNGTGKTRLSMEFKNLGKPKDDERDTLYFNAFTEDLFTWNNDLDGDENRYLILNEKSAFFDGLDDLDMDPKIEAFFHNYVDLKFDINYEKAIVTFSRSVVVDGKEQTIDNIKISRGEENLFRWCFFLAIYQLATDKDESYDWVKFVYIDDPISSLDENKAIAVACDLANLITDDKHTIKTVISTHHSLFFNVMFNELGRKVKNKRYFLHFKDENGYTLQDTNDTPFFHHIAVLSELKELADKVPSDVVIHTYHFNALRSILEKTASFFGYDKIDKCIEGLKEEDEFRFERALQLFSHGKYSIFDPVEMVDDNKVLFKDIITVFLDKYHFYIPEIFKGKAEEEDEVVEITEDLNGVIEKKRKNDKN